MRRAALALAILVAFACGTLVPWARAAPTATDELEVRGLDGLVITSHATGATSNLATDRSLVGKVASISSFTHGVVMLRVQKGPTGVFIDVVSEANVSTLNTTMGAMDLSSSVDGHPSTAEDSSDSAAIAAAGG